MNDLNALLNQLSAQAGQQSNPPKPAPTAQKNDPLADLMASMQSTPAPKPQTQQPSQNNDPLAALIAQTQQTQPKPAAAPKPQPQQSSQSNSADNALNNLLSSLSSPQTTQTTNTQRSPQQTSSSLDALIKSASNPPQFQSQTSGNPEIQNLLNQVSKPQETTSTTSSSLQNLMNSQQPQKVEFSELENLLGSLQSSTSSQKPQTTTSVANKTPCPPLTMQSPLLEILNSPEYQREFSGTAPSDPFENLLVGQQPNLSEQLFTPPPLPPTPSIPYTNTSASNTSSLPQQQNNQSSLSAFLSRQQQPTVTTDLSIFQSNKGQTSAVHDNKAEKLEVLKMTEKQIAAYKNGPSFQVKDKKRFDNSNTLRNFVCNLCSEGTVIEIPAGEYEGTLDLRRSAHLKAVGGKVVLKKTQDAAPVITSACPVLILEGFDIVQDTLDNAISVVEGFTRIINCRVTVNKHSAIRLSGKAIVETENCVFSKGYNPTVYVDENSTLYMKNTTVSDSEMSGVYVDKSGTCYIDEGCKFNQMANVGVIVQNQGKCLIKNAEFNGAKYAGIDCSTTFDTTNVSNCVFKNCAQGVVCDKSSFITVKNCQFERCDYSSLHAQAKARILSISNKFKDALGNMIVMANDHGVIQSENDSLSGSCNSCYCAFQDGYIQCNKATINNVSNTSALCYDQGYMRITNSKFENTRQVGVRLTDLSRCYIENTEISDSDGSGISGNNCISLYVKNVKITGMRQKGIDITNIKKGSVDIINCDIFKNDGGILIQGESTNFNCIVKDCQLHDNNKTGLEVSGPDAFPLITNCKLTRNFYAGAHFTLQCKPTIKDCQFATNRESGIHLEGGSPLIENCDITESINGFVALNGSKAVFKNCKIHENSNRGCQIQSQDTRVEVQQCHFYKHLNGIDLLAVESGSIVCFDTKFESSLKHHVNAMDGGYVCLNNCDLSRSSNGEGVRAISDGIIEIINSNIHNESKRCVLISDRGTVKATNSTFTENGSTGIYIEKGGKGEFVGCTISSNGQYGFDVHGGNLIIKDCTIKDHYAYGVFLDKGSIFNETNTINSSNGKGNVYRFA